MANTDSPSNVSFREWTTHYDKEQEADRLRITEVASLVGAMSGTVSKLSANMDTLIESQRGMHTRINRPWQWGVVVAGFAALITISAMFATMATLIVGPMQKNISHLELLVAENIKHNTAVHNDHAETLVNTRVNDAETSTNVEWILKMEQRGYDTAHPETGEQ